ncbi:uncharacterized protein MICPUCDRAFT_50734 [Micromonas pusilla CCMP1545]|uniref:Predicted protein n=1 Tax=Micromonas pusilla (strain CCMP1545) TaxID=564608 RepID=C1MIX7_MICPC|nr:uncharacterized protein MICPUCDRAFT_50734 [Micromonas pusilla CCMP1545]EEH60991.1 predicted protein [Micromonas pusilla CCMP1545]|eukprot:XP_003055739.1 predicted protein [Micromonas pusilla CCMP1545]
MPRSIGSPLFRSRLLPLFSFTCGRNAPVTDWKSIKSPHRASRATTSASPAHLVHTMNTLTSHRPASRDTLNSPGPSTHRAHALVLYNRRHGYFVVLSSPRGRLGSRHPFALHRASKLRSVSSHHVLEQRAARIASDAGSTAMMALTTSSFASPRSTPSAIARHGACGGARVCERGLSRFKLENA